MEKIEKIEGANFLTGFFIQRINYLAEKIKKENTNYYVDSKFFHEGHLLYLEMLISILDGDFTDQEQEHFKKYFILERENVIQKLLEKNLKY